ncbi:MAG: hypothetical protein CVV58_04625, partial [Tenericutes bacterium HGW-Tenericutes-3]
GVVTSSQYYRTFFIQDATGGIAVYTSDADLITFLTTNYGQEVAIIGTRAAYNGLDQISSTQIYTQVGEATMPTAVNIDSFGLDAEALAMYQGQLVELTGLAVTAVVTDNFGNVTITLYDANSNNSVTLKWDSRVTLSTEAAALLATIAVDDVIDVVTPLAWSNGPFLYFTDSTDVTEQVLTDAQRIALAKAVVESYFDAEYNEETTLSLGTSLFGATVVYDTASTYFDVATGDVTLPTIGRETVTVTATITLGTESDTATIEFVVGVINISTLPTTADATIVTVQGIVTSGEYNNTFFIQDASGAVAIYTSNADFTLALVVGNLVEVTGELDFYSGLVEVKPSSITVLATAQTLPTPMNVDTADLDDLVLIDYQSQVVIMTNMVVQSISTGSNNYSVFLYNAVADDSIELRYDVRFVISAPVLAVLQGLVVGDIVDVTSVLSWYNGAQLVYTETSIVVDTAVPSAAALAAVDTIKAESDAAELSVVDTVTEATTLVLPAAGTFLSTIVWTSSDDLVIDPTTGVVTLPAVGTVDVTLTATVTLNAAEVVVTFDVTVGVPEVVVEPTPFRDLIISEYVEPSTGNSKAIELYNAYFTTVDLSNYALVQYNNGKVDYATEYILPLVGTLGLGEVFVAYNPDSDPAMITLVQANADVYQVAPAYGQPGGNVMGFNGDDGMVLMKKDTNGDYTIIVDAIGKAAVDPGSAWTGTGLLSTGLEGTVSTANLTLVRKSSVLDGRIDYASDFNPATEWIAWPAQTWSNLGSHTID